MGHVDKYGNPLDPVTFDPTEGDYYERQLAELGDDPADIIGSGIFGSVGRFRVLAWIAGRKDPRFYGQLYWEETRHSTSSIGTILPKIAAMGMVEREPQDDGSRVVWYQRVPHPAWAIIEAANKVLEDCRRRQEEKKAKLTEEARKDIVADLVGVLAGG